MDNEIESKGFASSPYAGGKRGSKWKSASPDRYELLKAFAKENRKYMTEAESVFWQCVRGSALGHKFLRQHIIGDYIVDFLCRDAQVVVEIDGGYHRPSKSPCIGGLETHLNPLRFARLQKCLGRTSPDGLLSLIQANRKGLPSWLDPTCDQVEEDRIRQEWLESIGYVVVRFTNEEIVCDIDNTLNKVRRIINERYDRTLL